MADAARRSTSRRELMRNPHFAAVSPEVGELDSDALGELLLEDPDEALSLLVEMAGATDEALRSLARRLAGRVALDQAVGGSCSDRSVGRLSRQAPLRAEGEVDLDASLEEIVRSRASATPVDPDRLIVRSWQRPAVAICLLVDRSGSMLGRRLAAAAVAAAAVLFREQTECSVVAFADDAIVIKAQNTPRASEEVVGDLLRLRGAGVTNLALALRAAREQLERTSADRRVTLVLSDCRITTGGSALSAGAALDEVAVLAPADDSDDARDFAERIGARWTTLEGPSDIPRAFEVLLERPD